MNLNTAPNLRTNGKHIAPKGRNDMTRTQSQPQALKAPHTATNLTDVRCPHCHHFIIEGECLDSLTETPQKPVQTRVEPQLRQLNSSTWVVDSETYTLVSYSIKITDMGEYECTCPAYFYNRRCKHIARVIASMPQSKPLPPMHVLTTPTEVLVGRSTEMDLSDDPLVRLFVANGR